jgi:hypothetical protein
VKAIYTLALIAAGAVLINSTPLRASEVDSRIELSFNKSHADPLHLSYDAINLGEKTSAQVNERAGFRLQDEVGDRTAPQVSPDAGVQPATIYSPKLELRAAKPNNVVQSEKYPRIEYSGILVQSLRNNPLQLFNPFAPTQYGDGEANTFRNVITGRSEGLKVLSIRF